MGAPPTDFAMEGAAVAPRPPAAPAPTPVLSPQLTLSVEQQRAIAETQAAVFLAKSFPRQIDQVKAQLAITCAQPVVYRNSSYSYKRGAEEITGPNVNLLRTIVQAYGNMHFGLRELSRQPGVSTMQAYAWDLETNAREDRVFDVPHWRESNGSRRPLTSDRDIYENNANMGARRLRACLETVIRDDVIEHAVKLCDKALVGSNVAGEEQRAQLLAEYEALGVTKERIEARLNKKWEAATPGQLVKLMRGLTAIKDGVTTADEAFPPPAPAAGAPEPTPTKGAAGLAARLTREPGED